MALLKIVLKVPDSAAIVETFVSATKQRFMKSASEPENFGAGVTASNLGGKSGHLVMIE